MLYLFCYFQSLFRHKSSSVWLFCKDTNWALYLQYTVISQVIIGLCRYIDISDEMEIILLAPYTLDVDSDGRYSVYQ